MTSRIFKYQLDITDQQFVRMPQGAVILSAQFQGNDLVVWARVRPDNETEKREFRIFGTGNPCDAHADMDFIATVQQPDAPLVWHVFAETP